MKGKKGGQTKDTKLAAKYQDVEQCTTVMLRNIPSAYTQDELLSEVTETIGSADVFDFFYLPWDFQSNCNMTYAFVNFRDAQIAQQAVKLFSNYKFRLHESRRMGQVLPAHVQGLQNNLRHLQDRAVAHGNHPCSPIVMWKGQKIELSRVTPDVLRKFRSPSQGKGFMDDSALPNKPPNLDCHIHPPASDKGNGYGGKGEGFWQPHAIMPGQTSMNYQVDEGMDPSFARILDRAADMSAEQRQEAGWGAVSPAHGGGGQLPLKQGLSSSGQQGTDAPATKDSGLATEYRNLEEHTTVMIRNIPSKYTQDELLQEVREVMGSADMFDFFYLPWDFQSNGNIGYAFVNFHDSSKAHLAVELFSNYKFRTWESRRLGQVLPAHVQGLRNNLMHLQDRAVANGNHPCSPVVMWKGRKIELSKVTHELKTRDALRKFRAPAIAGQSQGVSLDDAMIPGIRAGPLSDGRSMDEMGVPYGQRAPPASQPSTSAGTDFGTQEEFAAILDKAAGFDTVDSYLGTRLPPWSQGRGTMASIQETRGQGMDYSLMCGPQNKKGSCDFFEEEDAMLIDAGGSNPSEPSTGSAPSFKQKAPFSSTTVKRMPSVDAPWVQAPASAPQFSRPQQGGYFQAVEEPVRMRTGPQSQIVPPRYQYRMPNFGCPQGSPAPGLSLPDNGRDGSAARPQAVPPFASTPPPPGLPTVTDARNVPEPNVPSYPPSLGPPMQHTYGPVAHPTPPASSSTPVPAQCPSNGHSNRFPRDGPSIGALPTSMLLPSNDPMPSTTPGPQQTHDVALPEGVLEITVQNAHVDVLQKFLTKFGE